VEIGVLGPFEAAVEGARVTSRPSMKPNEQRLYERTRERLGVVRG